LLTQPDPASAASGAIWPTAPGRWGSSSCPCDPPRPPAARDGAAILAAPHHASFTAAP